MSTTSVRISDNWISLLKSNGYRLTGPRYYVIEILAHSDKALTALDIYNQALSNYPSIGLVSVYRTLEKLEQLGLIQRVHQRDNCHAYVAAPIGHQHLLVCCSCGKVSFFSGDNLMHLVSHVEEKSGYLVQDHWLQLIGICEECNKTSAG